MSTRRTSTQGEEQYLIMHDYLYSTLIINT